MTLFWSDPERDLKITYEELLGDLNKIEKLPQYVYEDDPYRIFKILICSLCLDQPITLLDGDFSVNELKKMGITKSELTKENQFPSDLMLSDFNDIIARIKRLNDWRLQLFTSGTTGIPKPVEHNFDTLTRSVRTGGNYADNRWGLTYNATHFAGLQVFFQAFLNKNSIFYLFESSPKDIIEIIQSKQITNLSFTPTFFKQLIPYLVGVYESVKRVTYGGEKFDDSLLHQVKTHFPNAKVNNVYASTEAGSLFASQGEYFVIPERIKGLIKISSDNKLLIHKKLLGKSEAIKTEDNWYNTGDIVELINSNKLKFKSRESELVNIGGYNVNPSEVEELLFKLSFVKDVVIKARDNSVLGNILVAEVVLKKNEDKKHYEKKILDYSRQNLQEWKVPRIIKFVDTLELTRTGKKKRE